MALKKAILKAKIENEIVELMVKTKTDNIYLEDESTTLASKLAAIATEIESKAASADVTAEINAAISGLIGGAPETYDTLKKIADYIAEHGDVVTALNEAIGKKADKAEFDAVKATVDALGALSAKDKVAETDLDDALKVKVNAAAGSTHSHENKDVIDGITADTVAAWNGKGKVYTQQSQPENLTENDLWIQPID